MAIENAKTLNVRIKNKYDSYENWAASGLILEAGEIAVAYTTVNVTVDNGSIEQHPALLMKVGDGEKTFANLPWLSAKAADVPAYAKKSEADFKAWVKTFISIDDVDTSAFALAKDLTAEVSRAQAAEAQALTDAKAYTDAEITEWVGDKTVGVQISEAITALDLANTYDAKGAADQALTDAKAHANGLNAAMDTRVQAVEAAKHTHANKAELDLIETGDKAKWDAMEQNAKDYAKEYADGLNTTMDGRVADLEAMFGDGEGTVEAQIEAAVAAEKADREAADNALSGRVKAIEDDYLKAADKTALQDQITANAGDIADLNELVGDKSVATQISEAVAAEAEIARAAEKANADAIDAIEKDYLKAADKTELQGNIDTVSAAVERLTNGVSADEVDGVNDLIAYVNEHGTEVTGMKEDIQDNADEIAAIKADYLKAADKTALQDQITANDGDISALQTAVGTKAAQSDLEALAGRVTTVEGDLNTETTGLKARMTTAEADIDALENKVGDEPVADQISAAIEALKIGDYAKAADLTAAVARITQNETDIAALEGRMDTAEGDIEALETEVAKKANDSDLAAIAKTGSTDDLVQGDMVLLFDCGTSAM